MLQKLITKDASTLIIKRLVKMTKPGCGFFVNRPRRFGKSLVNTLEEYFKGNKEAFNGGQVSSSSRFVYRSQAKLRNPD